MGPLRVPATLVALALVATAPACGVSFGGARWPCHPKRVGGAVSAVALGDSITAGSSQPGKGQEAADSWFGRLVCDAHPPVGYGYNAGVPGDRTGGMLDRFDSNVRDRHPGTVFVLGGTNDVTFGPGVDGAIANLGHIIDRAQADHIRVVLGTVPPRDEDQFDARTIDLDDRIRKLAVERHVILVDFYAALAQGDDYAPGLTKDGVHPNAKGAELMAAAVRKALVGAGG
jgi:lysophospholipase L1-like esterase